MTPTLHHAGLLLLRTLPSAIMMTHGWPKFLRLVEQLGTESGVKFFDFMGLGPEVSLTLTVLAELVAPAMMILGFKTRLAAIPAAFTMGTSGHAIMGLSHFQLPSFVAVLGFFTGGLLMSWLILPLLLS